MISYVLTPHHFARVRERLYEDRDALQERHQQETNEFQIKLAAALAKLDELERAVIEMTAEGSAEPQAPKKSKKSTKPVIIGAVRSGNRKYTADEDAQLIAAADRNALRAFVVPWGRTFDGLDKRRETLLKQRRLIDANVGPVPAPEIESQSEVADAGERPTAPSPPIEAAPTESQPEPQPVNAAFDTSWTGMDRRRGRPGTPVDGIVDSGPDRRRNYDPVPFASSSRSE